MASLCIATAGSLPLALFQTVEAFWLGSGWWREWWLLCWLCWLCRLWGWWCWWTPIFLPEFSLNTLWTKHMVKDLQIFLDTQDTWMWDSYISEDGDSHFVGRGQKINFIRKFELTFFPRTISLFKHLSNPRDVPIILAALHILHIPSWVPGKAVCLVQCWADEGHEGVGEYVKA